jgi:hypothetical protein
MDCFRSSPKCDGISSSHLGEVCDLGGPGVTKNPDTGSGLDEVKYGYLLLNDRYAHINLPTMRGLNMMMVVLERVKVVMMGGIV